MSSSSEGVDAFTPSNGRGVEAIYMNVSTDTPPTSSDQVGMENQTTVFGGMTYATFNYQEEEYPFDDPKVRAIFLVLYTIVFCSCFFGNLMVILVVTLHWRMRSITNFCLANLAFADLCVGIFCVYQNIVTYLMESWVFGEFMCKMYYFINSLSTTASVLILIVICIERYLAIIHPMTCKQMMTLNRLRVTIVFVWILSAAISSPRFYYFKTISMPLPDNQAEILCLPDRTKYNSKLMDMSSMIVLFLVPLAIITFLYTHIGIVLWRSSNNNMPTSTPTPSAESISSSDYYREPDTNIVQTVNLTLLPVATATSQCLNNRPATLNSFSPHPEKRSLLPSPFTCLQCRIKSRKKKSTNKKSTLRQHSKAAQTPSLECKLGGNVTGNGQDFLMNCKACQKPYIHQSHLQEGLETTSFIQGGHYQENTVEEVKSDSPVSSCCGGRKRFCRKSEKAGTFTTNPPSPFCDRTCTCLEASKTEPIVLVKFEKQNQTNKNGRKGQCTILINTKSCHGTTTPCRHGKHGGCSIENGTEGDSPLTISPSPPRCEYTDAHQLGHECCRETGNDVPLVHFAGNGSVCRGQNHKNYSLEHKRNLSDDSGISTQGRHHDGSLCSCENHNEGACAATCPSCGISCVESQQLSKCHQHFPSPKILPPLAANVPKRVRRMRITRSNKYGTGALQSRRRIIRMLIVVVLAFALCHLPFHARKVWQYWSPKWAQYQAGSFFSTMFTPITFLIMYANSAINPLLYAFMSKKFRMSFKDLLCCRMRHSLRMSRNASVRSTHALALSQSVPGL